MDYVVNQLFFHVSGDKKYVKSPPLEVGQKFRVGEDNNPFFGFYEEPRMYNVNTPNGTHRVPAIKFLDLVAKSDEVEKKYLEEAATIARHFNMLVRELIMEEMRKKINEAFPSRQRCLWVTRTFDEAKGWKKKLGQGASIFKMNLTGLLYEVDASWLLSDSESLSETYSKADKYWRGEKTARPQMECLFEGDVEVVGIN